MTRAQRWWLLVVVLAVAGLVVSRRAGHRILATGAAQATATPSPVRPDPSPTPSPTPLPPTPVTGSWSITLPIEPEPTTSWPSPPPPPSATPTAGLVHCVTLDWTTAQAFDPMLHVLVEVEMRNDCGRDLEPLAVWVRVQGWRQGGLVQEVMGHPFFRLDAGGRQHFGVGLPGSLDWFDDIRVEVEEPGSPQTPAPTTSDPA